MHNHKKFGNKPIQKESYESLSQSELFESNISNDYIEASKLCEKIMLSLETHQKPKKYESVQLDTKQDYETSNSKPSPDKHSVINKPKTFNGKELNKLLDEMISILQWQISDDDEKHELKKIDFVKNKLDKKNHVSFKEPLIHDRKEPINEYVEKKINPIPENVEKQYKTEFERNKAAIQRSLVFETSSLVKNNRKNIIQLDNTKINPIPENDDKQVINENVHRRKTVQRSHSLSLSNSEEQTGSYKLDKTAKYNPFDSLRRKIKRTFSFNRNSKEYNVANNSEPLQTIID